MGASAWTGTSSLPPAEFYRSAQEGSYLLLDVRNADDFARQRIVVPGGIETLNIPYFEFIEDEDGSVAKVRSKPGQTVVAVCAKGDSSEYVAGILRERGITAINLEGGGAAGGALVAARDLPARQGLLVRQYDRVAKGCLSYLIAGRDLAIVVDPFRQIDRYLADAEALGVRIGHVVDTHLHADHISGGPALALDTGARYHLHEADAAGQAFSVPLEGPLAFNLALGDGQVATVEQYHSPGHTPGSTSLLVDGRFLITGDMVFVSSVGRPDLGGKLEEWARDLYRTLTGRLAALPDTTEILPAHYSGYEEARTDGILAGSLGALRHTNPALRARDEAEFLAFIRASITPQPEVYSRIRQVNLGRLKHSAEEAAEFELGRNECAVSRARVPGRVTFGSGA